MDAAPAPRLQLSGITKRLPGGRRQRRHRSRRSCPARSTRCSARTAPANRRWSRSSTASSGPTPARSAGTAKRSSIDSPAKARALGIGMVFQQFSLFETLTVAENIALALDRSRGGRELDARIRETSARYGLPLDPRRHVHTLSVGERQRVEIVRCLLQTPRAADHGRADVGADAAGGRASCSPRCGGWPPKAARSSTSATSSTRSARCATARRCCAREASPATAIRAGRAAPSLRA